MHLFFLPVFFFTTSHVFFYVGANKPFWLSEYLNSKATVNVFISYTTVHVRKPGTYVALRAQ